MKNIEQLINDSKEVSLPLEFAKSPLNSSSLENFLSNGNSILAALRRIESSEGLLDNALNWICRERMDGLAIIIRKTKKKAIQGQNRRFRFSVLFKEGILLDDSGNETEYGIPWKDFTPIEKCLSLVVLIEAGLDITPLENYPLEGDFQ